MENNGLPPQSAVAPESALKSLLAASWESTRNERGRFFLFVVLFIIAYSIDLVTPWAIGYILGVFVTSGFTEAAFNQAATGVGIYVALKFAYLLAHHYARFQQIRVAYSARMHTLNKLFGAFMNYPLSWHVRHHSGDSLSKLHRSAGAIENCIGTYVWQVIEGVVKIVFAGIAIFALDIGVALNVLIMSALSILFMVLFNKRLVQRIRRNNAFNDKLNRMCVDQLFNIVTVKTLSLETHAKKQISKLRDEGALYIRKIAKYGELKWGSVGMGYSLVIGSSLLIYFYHHTFPQKVFDIAQVYVLLNYLDRVFQAIGSFTGYYSGFVEASTAYEDATRIVQGQSEIKALPQPILLRPDWKELSIENLNFAYSLDQHAGMKNVAFSMKNGDKIALVGPSGGGKSTLLKLLGGLLEAQSGRGIVDGKEDVSLSVVNASSLLIPQEPEIFSESFRYNLTFDEHFDELELLRFLKLGRLESVLAKLKNGWDTSLEEKGLNLSVGEKQRVALVRGLLRAKFRPIILLDEPTSSLDPSTEKQIFLEFLQFFSDRTIITACHRLNIVPLFNRVMYVLDGRIMESGSFDELIRRGGYFAKAWEDYERNIKKAQESHKSASELEHDAQV